MDVPNKHGKYPLHIAISSYQIMKAKELIYSGVDINVKDRYGITPLMYACKYKRFGIMKLLIKKGVDINYEVLGDNALSFALTRKSRRISQKIAHYLIENGINVNMKNFFYSIINGYPEISNIIVRKLTFGTQDDMYISEILLNKSYLISKSLFKKMFMRSFRNHYMMTNDYSTFLLFKKHGRPCHSNFVWYPLPLEYQDNETLISLFGSEYEEKASKILSRRKVSVDDIINNSSKVMI